MNLSVLSEAVVSGIVTALVWAGLVWVLYFVREHRTKRQLQQILQPKGITLSINGFGVPIENPTGASIVVRQVVLRVNSPHVRNLILSYEPDRIAHPGDTPSAGSLLHRAQLERGFVELPPKTGGTWMLRNSFFEMLPLDIEAIGCKIVVEYGTLFGDRDVLEIEGSEETSQWLKGGLQHHIDSSRPKLEEIRRRGEQKAARAAAADSGSY